MSEENANNAANADDAEAAPPEKIIVKLTKPIQVRDQEVTELTLRAPTGADILKLGSPVIFDPVTAQVTHNMAVAGAMIAALANIPVASVARLDPKDMMSITWDISPFFLPRL